MATRVRFAANWLETNIKLTYGRAILIGSGVASLLLIVGLAAGLGPNRSCPANGGSSSESSAVSDRPWRNFKLPGSIVPRQYDLFLDPAFENDDERSFEGQLTVELEVVEETPWIIFHSSGLNISSITVKNEQNSTLKIARTFTQPSYNYFIVEMAESLDKGSNLVMKLRFQGQLAATSDGFYKTAFINPTTKQKLPVVMIHIGPFSARRVFPCFDEPHLKAPFQISIRHNRALKALSNMPVESFVEESGNIGITKFENTPAPMSTYLVSVVVGPFVQWPGSPADSTPISLWLPVFVEQAKAAATLDAATKLFKWLESELFKTKFPLPKLDLVGLPELRGSVMESWGLILLDDTELIDEHTMTEIDIDHLTDQFAHHLTHQWFGNLVTLESWDDLWLLEGFQSYVDGFALSSALGRMVDGEEYYDAINVMADGALPSSRPIRFASVKVRSDIQTAFDGLSFSKASCLIRMLARVMGPQKFSNAVQQFMLDFGNKTARPEDFWKVLSSVYASWEVDFNGIMPQWTDQKGYPLLTVETGTNKDEVIVHQQPFNIPQANPEPSETAVSNGTNDQLRKWTIPLSFLEPSGAQKVEWLNSELAKYVTRVPGLKAGETKLNYKQNVLMRVNYPVAVWDKFADKLLLDPDYLGPIDRAGLVDDSLELAKAGLLPYESTFKVLRYLEKETHPLVWDVVIPQIQFLEGMLQDSPHWMKLRVWLGGALRSARTLAQSKIAESAVDVQKTANPNYLRIIAVLNEYLLRFDPTPQDFQCFASKYYKTRSWQLPGNRESCRAIFMAYIATNDTAEAMTELLQMPEAKQSAQVLKQVYFAISTTKHFPLLVRELEKIYSDEISSDEFLILAKFASSNIQHRRKLWDWARHNLELLSQKVGNAKFLTWLVNTAKYFSARIKYSEFQAFASTIRDFGDAARARRLVEEQIRRNVYWRENLRSPLESLLSNLQLPLEPNLPQTVAEC